MATAPTTPIRRREMQEIKEPEMFQFNKPGQVIGGVLISIEPTLVKGKEAAEYIVQGENNVRLRFLETADLKKKIHPGLIGHWLEIRYERDDTSFTKEGQNAMKLFKVSASKEKEPGF